MSLSGTAFCFVLVMDTIHSLRLSPSVTSSRILPLSLPVPLLILLWSQHHGLPSFLIPILMHLLKLKFYVVIFKRLYIHVAQISNAIKVHTEK